MAHEPTDPAERPDTRTVLSGTDYLNALPDGGVRVPQELGEALCLAPKRLNVSGELVEVIVFGAEHEADALTEATAWYDQHREELILRALWIEKNDDPLPAPPGEPPDFRYEVCLAVTGCSLTDPPPPPLRSV